MSINGIGTGYLTAGYETRKTVKNGTKGNFADQAAEAATIKAAQAKAAQEIIDYDEKAFESIAPNAPEEVKRAWMEAAKEVGVNGLGTKKNGMLSHISQMMVERVERAWNGSGMAGIQYTRRFFARLEIHIFIFIPESLETYVRLW